MVRDWTTEISPLQNLEDIVGLTFYYTQADRDTKSFKIRPVLIYRKLYKTIQGYRLGTPYYGPWYITIQSSNFSVTQAVTLVNSAGINYSKLMQGPLKSLYYVELEEISVPSGNIKLEITGEIKSPSRKIRGLSKLLWTNWLHIDPAKSLTIQGTDQSPWNNMDGSLIGFFRGPSYFYLAETYLPSINGFTSRKTSNVSIICDPLGFSVQTTRILSYELYEHLPNTLRYCKSGTLRKEVCIAYSPRMQVFYTDGIYYILEKSLCQ